MIDMLLTVLEQACLYLPLVVGAYISISLLKTPDLGIESAYVFGAICAARFIPLLPNWSLPVTLVCAMLVSMFGGMCVGGIVFVCTRRFNIPHLLASILTIGIFHGLNQLILGASNVSLAAFENPLASFNFINGHPECIVLFGTSLLLIMSGLVFFRTQLGYSFFIYGNNPLFFENYGISARYVFCCGLLSAHALAGIGGYFVAQSSSFVDISAGFGMTLFSVTCLILGKAFVRRRLFTICVPIVGIVVYCIIQQLLLKVGFDLKYFTMIQSLIVLSVLVRQYRKGALRRFKIDNLGV